MENDRRGRRVTSTSPETVSEYMFSRRTTRDTLGRNDFRDRE